MHAVLERVVDQISSEMRHLDAEATQLHPKGLVYKWNAQQVGEHLVIGGGAKRLEGVASGDYERLAEGLDKAAALAKALHDILH